MIIALLLRPIEAKVGWWILSHAAMAAGGFAIHLLIQHLL